MSMLLQHNSKIRLELKAEGADIDSMKDLLLKAK